MNAYRRLHRWGALVAGLPLLVIVASGLLLQLKRQSSWIQPPTREGAGGRMQLGFDDILAAARGTQAGIDGWGDVDRLDVRPAEGIVKVRGKNGWEVQASTRVEERYLILPPAGLVEVDGQEEARLVLEQRIKPATKGCTLSSRPDRPLRLGTYPIRR